MELDCITNYIVYYVCMEVSICCLKGFASLPTGDWFYVDYFFESCCVSVAKLCLVMLYAEDFKSLFSYLRSQSPCLPPTLLHWLSTMNIYSAYEWPHP